MTAPNPQDPARSDSANGSATPDVWTPTLVSADDEAAAAPGPPTGNPGTVVWHDAPEPPAPPWRTTTPSRIVALNGGRLGADRETEAEVARLREAAAASSERIERQRALVDQLDRQLTEARSHASTEGMHARRAERRVAELRHELAQAHEELERQRALDMQRTERVIETVTEHHRSLVTSLRSAPTLGPDTAPAPAPGDEDAIDGAAHIDAPAEPGNAGASHTTAAATNPTLLAVQHWLGRPGALAVVDGDALAIALAKRREPSEAPHDPGAEEAATDRSDDDTASARTAAVAALHAGLGPHAEHAAIIFDGSRSTAPPIVSESPEGPRVLVTAPDVEVTSAVGALVGVTEIGPIVLMHDAVAASGMVSAGYRLSTEALADALA